MKNTSQTMRRLGIAAILAAFAVAAWTTPGEAQSRKTTASQRGVNQNTVVTFRDENGRTRTRVIVTPRSYLDGGTEVLPGQRKFTDYAIPPYWTPIDILGPGKTYDRQPLNPIWESGWTRGWY